MLQYGRAGHFWVVTIRSQGSSGAMGATLARVTHLSFLRGRRPCTGAPSVIPIRARDQVLVSPGLFEFRRAAGTYCRATRAILSNGPRTPLARASGSSTLHLWTS